MSNEVVTNTKQVTLSGMLDTYKSEIARALPKHVSVERMARIAMTAARINPDLLECSPESFLGAVIQSAQLGLEPNTSMGHAALVPFFNSKTGKKEVNFMPMYRGMMELVYRAANHPVLQAVAVYERDKFKYTQGLSPVLEHEPMPRQPEDKLTFVYCIALFQDGRKPFRVMSRAEVEACRARSKSKGFTPWTTDYEAMALKTVIRQTVKYLPMSAELQQAVGLDELAERGDSQHNENWIKEGRPIHTKGERVEGKMAGEPGDFDGSGSRI